ncbi:glycine betaine/proline transport system substrate-binding protein [Halanaerobium saccharolyticum]|uniref:Glycine betaine/proline transport system substrate-binding protein n=1 Tax=Halanaerobium saccharolyticum TaxID=43595 RepID=A0A4R6LPZ9_9FIRM|nr:glycine betaine ABC transporter substrate-binding protein [Halanaerobium saccharolyticum]TDO85880.1 glycine betaine/proline transport system substrate-binding protein [Halanaerobium saccharolyticum]
MRKNHLILILLFVLLISFSLGVKQNVKAQSANFEETIVLGEASWPGIQAKNAIVEKILEAIGYDVERTLISMPLIYEALAGEEIDIWLGSWLPAQKSLREEYSENYEFVRTHLDEAYFISAVPEYVYEAGVKSHSDLDDYAAKFNKKIYAGVPGSGSDEVISRAIKNNIYGLGDWEKINASWPATITQVEKKIKNEDWVVFPGWEPHWMNLVIDFKYLKDPKKIWGQAESKVDTIIRTGFKEDYPNLYKFLENFTVNSEMQSSWTYQLVKKNMDAQVLAKNWIKNNLKITDSWLAGVKDKRGKRAAITLREKMTED